ncbi:hypothetical protein H310_04235 [Aphanomyces invadans]|uniref:Uncharacterized protein n=1 Tax=Aphanomyces invadans TaxID=157072 RepID=A0A024UHC9_9STRA|nr:hypothetical protein H310_04235 [Aphanomyces invadans]ETW05277.1 hypothetical protein H310_04235 [Aphanomyces invadans]|eukprot:XP_008866715.1 hypothetical protein H310_04235 [Aphanomyces invadans]
MLATELSVAMKREFTAKQVQDKLAKMKTEWSLSKPSLAAPTGNTPLALEPLHYEVMLEYWGEKVGFQRESLMSTDDVCDDDNSETKQDHSSNDDEESAVVDEGAQEPKQKNEAIEKIKEVKISFGVP